MPESLWVYLMASLYFTNITTCSAMAEYRKFKRPFPPTARAHLGAHPAPPEAPSQPFSRPRGPRKRLAGRPPLAARSGSQA